MRRRVGVAEPCGAVDLETEAARRALAIFVAEITKAPRIAGAIEQLRVLECDFARLTGRDGKHARADQSLAGELDQGRIALLPDDCFIDGAGLRGVHRLAAQLLIPLPERIAREDGLAGQREVIHPFVECGAVVAEPLLHGNSRDASTDADLHGAAEPLDRSGGILRHGSNRVDPALGTEHRRESAKEGGHSQHT